MTRKSITRDAAVEEAELAPVIGLLGGAGLLGGDQAAPLSGGIEAADRWLVRPALGLGGRRPLDLLETPLGGALVADDLVQRAYGVYV